MLRVVAPVLHKYALETGAVNITLPPTQKLREPPGVIVGVAVTGRLTIPVVADTVLVQPAALITCTL